MAKFTEYRDIFKWNKQLMEDDWNDGQAYVVKHVMKGDDTEFTTTAKVGEAKGDSHKVSLEHKMKLNQTKDNAYPFDSEIKLKNNGEIHADVKSDFLKSYEGLEHVRVITKGCYNTNATPWSLGFSYMNDTVKTDLLVDTSGDHSATANFNWQVAPWLIFGGTKTWKNALDVMNNVSWKCAFAGHFQKELQWGVLLDGQSDTLADTTVKASTMYFNH